MNFTLKYIADVCGALSSTADPERIIEGFFTDSRTPDKSKLFLALRGERVDANEFVPELLKNGCAVMTDSQENLSLSGDYIYVKDVRTALLKLAKHFRETKLLSTEVVGITGSVGKTTTKDMVALALSSGLSVHKTLGNANSQIGLPQTVLATPADVDCAVFELGMSEKGEMERIASVARPRISVITNIGYSHIENLGSREAIRNEKLKIASFSPNGSILVLNGDEPLLREYNYENKKVCFVSYENSENDCYATNISESEQGVCFEAVVYGETVEVALSVRGKHFVINSLFALAVAYHLDLDLSKAAAALNNYESDGKRQYIYQTNGHTVISDCYNASPESMEAALSVLKTAKGRRIAVLGDMLELGNESASLHKRVGEYLNGCADVLVTYGEQAEYIASTARIETYSFKKEEAEKLKQFLNSFVKEGDTVLYKASNGMKLGLLIV